MKLAGIDGDIPKFFIVGVVSDHEQWINNHVLPRKRIKPTKIQSQRDSGWAATLQSWPLGSSPSFLEKSVKNLQ